MSLSLKIKGLDVVAKATKNLEGNLKKEINNQFKAFGDNVQEQAKALAPSDEGDLRSSIVTKEGDLKISIFSRLDYAAYLEFGTRKFAAAYVNSLPQDWQTYAATFKGKGNSSGDFFERILAWVKRKGIAQQDIQPIRIAKTGRVTRNRKQENTDDEAAAYQIAMSILRNGIKAQPFLYPAFRDQVPELEKRLKNLVK